MLRIFCALLLCLAAVGAQAQSCPPKTWLTPSAAGSDVIEFASGDGIAPRWWCPAPSDPAGPPQFTLSGVTCLTADCQRLLFLAMGRVLSAATPWDQALAEIAANSRTPAPGSAEECAWKRLHRDACVATRQVSLGGSYPAALTASQAEARCGPPVDCSTVPPPVLAWRTPASSTSGTLALYAVTGGKKASTPIPGRSAPFNALCDCAVFRQDVKAGTITTTYCALAGGPATECTLCRQVSQ